MSVSLHKTALQKSILNTANLSGFAAIFLSYSIGSMAGTIIFALSVIIGSINKYRSVLNNHQKISKNTFIKILQTPALTAQILMLGALINFIKTSYDAFQAPSSEVLYFSILAGAWFFGFLGDDILRRNDTTNFSAEAQSKQQPLWMKAFIYVTRNPVFYYIITNMFFAGAIILYPEKTAADTSTLHLMNMVVIGTSFIGTSFIGIIYAARQGTQMAKGEITPEKTNNGIINIVSVLTNFEVAGIALIQGLHFIVIAQILYALANVIALYETRHALEKERHF